MMSKRLESWKVSDEFWSRVEPLVPIRQRPSDKFYQRRAGGGRKPMSARQVFEGIMYVLRTGCQWKALPREYGSGSAVHRYFLAWESSGFFLSLWQAGLAEYDEMEEIAWEWQSIDGATTKAPLARESVGKNPTDRGKKGQQTQSAGGRSWRPVVHRRGGRESARCQTAGSDVGRRGG
jgi:transposase